MDEAEILQLKARTPRLRAREGLSPWAGACAPPSPGTRVGRGGDTTQNPLPRVSAPGPESLIAIIN